MHRVFASLAIVVLLLAAHQTADARKPGVRRDMLVSPGWLEKNISKPGTVIIQVGRSKKDYDEGHVPGASFVAIGDLITTRDGALNEIAPVEKLVKVFSGAGVDNGSRIVLYSDSYNLLAARAYFTLDYLGLGDRSALLDGGFEKWKKERRPLTTQSTDASRGGFTVRLNPGVLATWAVVADVSWAITNIGGSGYALIDARPRTEFTGEVAGDGVKRAGHIPGAASIYWNEMNLVSNDDPVLRSVRDLENIYQSAGALKGHRVISYCRTGMQASHTYFVAKYLGYEVSLYDGSFMEWSNKEGLAVERGTKTK